MKYLKIISMLSLTLSYSFKTQSAVTIGWSSDCDYDESIISGQIQAAIDAGETEIRVSNAQAYLNPLSIKDTSLSIKGGYDSCSDATNDIQSSVKTQLQGDDFNQSAIFIESEENTVNITIENFEIFNASGGNGNNGNFSGGINVQETIGTLNLNNLDLHHNLNNFIGGGIGVFTEDNNQAFEINMSDVISHHNSSSTGGGLNCKSNGLTQINVSGQSGFSFNQADHQGGGIYLDNCNLHFIGGTLTPSELNLQGIHANTAVNDGGGIQAVNASHVVLSGNAQWPINITDNSANNGGGISLNGFGSSNPKTSVEFNYSWIADNTALGGDGGAVYAENKAEVVFKPNEKCIWNDLCHLVKDNISYANGGAFHIEDGAVIQVNKGEITGSRSSLSGAVAALFGDGSNLTLNNSLIHHNGGADHSEFRDWYLIRNLSNQVTISINYSTLADNLIQFASLSPFDGAELMGNFNLTGTTVTDDVSALTYHSPPVNWQPSAVVSCVVFKEVFTNPDIYHTYQQVIVAEPTFINPAAGNYRLDWNDTVAIDRCDESNYPAALSTDVDGQVRPFDLLSIADDLGTLDIGYDEVSIDLIFKNGFNH